jgi:hypothetical protein
MAGDWWRQLGDYVESNIGKIDGMTSTIVGDLPQILHVRPKEKPKALTLVTQGTSEGRFPREFCISISADHSDDEKFVDGLIISLRTMADYARDSDRPFALGDTVAFADPAEPLWEGSAYAGYCIADGAISGGEGDLFVEGMGFIPLLLAAPVFAEEMTKPTLRGRQVLRNAMVAKGYHTSVRPKRPSLAKWSLWN